MKNHYSILWRKRLFFSTRREAFTLIELLVVIAIIGILATIVIINVSAARAKAVDAHVLVDITTADQTAATCMVIGDYLYNPQSYGVIFKTGLSWVNGSYNIPDTGPPICALTAGGANDQPATVGAPGNWPKINTYGNAPDGYSWGFGFTGNKLLVFSPSGFSFSAQTYDHSSYISGNYRIDCTQTGCTKMDGSDNPASW